MALQGKGFFIWQIKNVEGGDPAAIAKKAAAAGLSHVLIKIADGNYPVNIDQKTRVDLAPPVALALKARGIQVWGWHYVYGYDPVGEARIAIKRIQQMGLHGYVIDAEGEYKQPGRDTAAVRFMHELRGALPNFPIALSSFRFPSYHPQLPWKAFLDHCDYNMPQVYWLKAHNAGAQLRRCVQEFQAMQPYRPIIPTGAAFKEYGWRPADSEILEFLETARALKLPAANFFSWDECCRDLGGIWNLISRYSWNHGPQPPNLTPVEKLFAALNNRDAAQAAKLYNTNAVVVTPERTLAGPEAIKSWYTRLMTQTLPGGVYNLTGVNGSGPTRHFTWTALSTEGRVQDGAGTIGLLDDKIAYHYTYFNVTPA